MRHSLTALSAGLTLAFAAAAHADAVSDAVAAFDAAQPSAIFSSQTLAQIDDCTLAVTLTEAEPAESETAMSVITADFATLDFGAVQRAPMQIGDVTGLMVLVPTVGMEPTVQETGMTTGSIDRLIEATESFGGTCTDGTCETTSPTPMFRFAAISDDSDATATALLAALEPITAACAAQ